FQERFVQTLEKRLVQFLFGTRCLRLFLLAPGYGFLMLDLGFSFLMGARGGICYSPLFFSQYFLAFVLCFLSRVPLTLSFYHLLLFSAQIFRCSLRVRHRSNKYRRHDRDQTFLGVQFVLLVFALKSLDKSGQDLELLSCQSLAGEPVPFARFRWPQRIWQKPRPHELVIEFSIVAQIWLGRCSE